jgi:threonine dehydratase
VSRIALQTPLIEAPILSERVGLSVLLKLENLQATGSFKVRGAASRLAVLSKAERQKGVVACSSGNHGRAVAWVASRMGVPATICVPDWVDPVKLEAIRRAGAEAVLAGPTYDAAEAHAQALAAETRRTFVSAFDDPWVIAGQGTLGLEILRATRKKPPTAVLAPLSGGGLLGGIGAAVRAEAGAEAPAVVGVSAERAAVMLASLVAGRPVQLPEETTLASALSGGIGLDNRHTFPLVRDLDLEHVVVTEDEIATAMTFCCNDLHIVVEGGGAVGIAAILTERWRPPDGADGPVVVVVSGGNVSPEVLARVLAGRGPDA